jgi:dTDP-glucose pyrophosphorylase/CBS domain-containing protein
VKNLDSYKVGLDTTIHEALKVINKGVGKIALVVDGDQKLIGTVTDGDMRRGLLSGVDMQSPVSMIMKVDPVTAKSGDDRQLILSIMQQNVLRHIPIVDAAGRLLRLEALDELEGIALRENTVLLMAGGLGARLKPLTNKCPKPMLKVGGKPILEIIILNFIEFGFKKFVISLNYKANMIREYFSDGHKWDVSIQYIEEDERLGTAGSLRLLPEIQNSHPVIVMNGDVLTKVNLCNFLDFHTTHRSKATMGVREYNFQVPYGVLKLDQHRIIKIEEKPVHDFFVNAGIYVLDQDVLACLPAEERIEMPDLFEHLIKTGHSAVAFPICEYWLDIGQPDNLKQAHGDFKDIFE